MLFFVLLVPAPSRAGEIFTLEKSIQYALVHSPVLKSARIQVDQADVQIKSERGRFLPAVSLGYSYSKIYSIDAEGPTDEDYLDQNRGTVSCSVIQSLFSGFENKNRYQRAKLGKEYQEAQVAVQQLDLVYRVQSVFLELLKLRYDIDNITRRLDGLEADLKMAKAYSERNLAPYVYVLQAEADLENARQERLQNQTAINRRIARLNVLLGLSPDPEDPVAYHGRLQAFQPARDLNACLAYALKNRLEFSLLALQRRMAEKDMAISMGAYYPKVNIEAGFYDTDRRYDEDSINAWGLPTDIDQKNTYWMAGITVNWNLFDGGSAYYGKKRYYLELKRLEEDVTQLTREVNEDVSTAHRALSDARKRITFSEKAILAAREAYQREQKRLEARIGTTPQVLDARARLARAESEESQALLDYQLARVELDRAMGKNAAKTTIQQGKM